jgi:hypothetical protein
MDGLTLLARARGAGLIVVRDGDLLRVTGPSGASGVAQQIIDAKPAILAALEAEREQLLRLSGEMRAAWSGAVIELGAVLGWPHLEFKPGHSVAIGRSRWQVFARFANVPDLQLVVAEIRERLAVIPHPEAV